MSCSFRDAVSETADVEPLKLHLSTNGDFKFAKVFKAQVKDI